MMISALLCRIDHHDGDYHRHLDQEPGKLFIKNDGWALVPAYHSNFNTVIEPGIAADTMKINGALRQFKQVSCFVYYIDWKSLESCFFINME